MPNPKSSSFDSKHSSSDSRSKSSSFKSSNADSKNSSSSFKSNNAESKNSNSSFKSNNADSKNSNSSFKSNNADSKNSNSSFKNNNTDPKNNTASFKHNNADLKHSDSKGSTDGSPQGDGAQPSESQFSLNGNKIYKSGPLLLSSKGIGWTSWKKRWFVLTETSLVFFRGDPNAAPQKGIEVNLPLGGIDLNSSGSVVVKADKKLLTVLFPDGRDGRAFTLKAETTEDLNEWKAALEEALANAPSPSIGVGQNGILKNEKGDTADGSSEQSKDKTPAKSIVLGRPILLALEDIDGTPSFLEKALRYVEDYGVKVEGILRQAADVEAVECRIREYEQGKTELTENEDAHVIGDCIKYILRELPSSPVPASCCTALLEAFRNERGTRVSAMRAAICDTFPEPNRRLLQRMLMMMESVADNKAVNRMSVSAVAACMSPLLLRPLLNGECNLESEFSMGGDGSAQLLQAAAAANHAQAIVITLLEEYDAIFGEGDVLSDLYDSEESGSEASDEYAAIYDDDDGSSDGSYIDEDSERASSNTGSESRDDGDSDHRHNKGSGTGGSNSTSSDDPEASDKSSPSSPRRSKPKRDKVEANNNASNQNKDHSTTQEDDHTQKSSTVASDLGRTSRRRTVLGRASARKNLSMENINMTPTEESEIPKPEAAKDEPKGKTETEARENSVAKEDPSGKKKALEERRQVLEKEVAGLQERLQKEIEFRKRLESALKLAKEKESDAANIPKSDSSMRKTKRSNSRVEDKSSSKDSENKGPFHSLSRKLRPNQQSDSENNPKTEPKMKKSSSKSIASNSRNEANTTSTMSKITTGLNFLKGKGNQITDEFQNMNKPTQKQERSNQKGSEDEERGKLGSFKTYHTESSNTNIDRGKPENVQTDT